VRINAIGVDTFNKIETPDGCIGKETNSIGFPDDVSKTGATDDINDSADAADDNTKVDMFDMMATRLRWHSDVESGELDSGYNVAVERCDSNHGSISGAAVIFDDQRGHDEDVAIKLLDLNGMERSSQRQQPTAAMVFPPSMTLSQPGA
jgi:hypothetical protein